MRAMRQNNIARRLSVVKMVMVIAVAAVSCAAGNRLGAQDADNIFSKAIDAAQRRCVKIYGAGVGAEAGYATGVIVSGDGQILTAQGIYLTGNRIRVVLPNGDLHTAKIVRRSDSLQSALLKVEAATPEFFELPKKSSVRKGDWVLAVSNLFKVADGSEPLSVNLGIVSLRTKIEARHRTQDVPYTEDVLLIDAISSNPGASGGALVDAEGHLVGMIGKLLMSKSTNTRINYAVPADLLYGLVHGEAAQVAKGERGTAGKAELGIRLFTLSGKRSPAYIDRVVTGSPAHKAGLRPDDLIVTIGTRPVRSIRDYERIVKRLRPGKEITLVVKRKREVVLIKITPTTQGASDAK